MLAKGWMVMHASVGCVQKLDKCNGTNVTIHFDVIRFQPPHGRLGPLKWLEFKKTLQHDLFGFPVMHGVDNWVRLQVKKQQHDRTKWPFLHYNIVLCFEVPLLEHLPVSNSVSSQSHEHRTHLPLHLLHLFVFKARTGCSALQGKFAPRKLRSQFVFARSHNGARRNLFTCLLRGVNAKLLP